MLSDKPVKSYYYFANNKEDSFTDNVLSAKKD